ncbi:conserved Plasmodium protein, unknown function, partial [Plasmodium ovale curtisi]
MKTNEEETNNHVDNKNGEGDKIFENKFNDINLKLEAYGEGDYRLLRYLPDGSLAFEEVPNEETKNKQHLQQYAQIFCSEMEKYKIQNSNDLNLKNNSEWNKGEEYRILVENELKEIMILFDMILGTLNYDKGTKYLSLNKCNYYRDPEENKQDICISVTNRIEILEKLKKLCENERIQLNSINGIIAQKYYLFFINQLIKHWRILYTKYSEIDYMQIDSNFPYCTEFSIIKECLKYKFLYLKYNVAIEAPLLIETKLYLLTSPIILIKSSVKNQIKRILSRDKNCTYDTAMGII